MATPARRQQCKRPARKAARGDLGRAVSRVLSAPLFLKCSPPVKTGERLRKSGGENHLSQRPIPGTAPLFLRLRQGPWCPQSPRRSGVERAAPQSPIWPCTRWGFPCLHACAWSGGLLPRHFTLTQPFLRPAGSHQDKGAGAPAHGGRCYPADGFRKGWAVCFLWHCPSECLSALPPACIPKPAFLRRRLRVTRHRALRCSDFPPPARAGSDPPPFQNQGQYTRPGSGKKVKKLKKDATWFAQAPCGPACAQLFQPI